MSQQPKLILKLLGPSQIILDGGRASGFDSDKVRALFFYLAVEADRPHRRERLAGLLWPDFPERSARTNLRSALANLRQVLGDHDADPPFLHITRQTIQFNIESDSWIDVADFQNLIQEANVEDLKQAAALYKADFLEGFTLIDSAAFEEWVLQERQSLASQATAIFYRLAQELAAASAYQSAILYARRQVDLDPYREEGHRQLMRLLALNGQTAEALAQYQTCKEILADELSVEPAVETTALFERIKRGEFNATSSPLPLQPVRGYELRDLIGAGHFGAVYRAYQPVIARDVAIKIILPQYADDPNFIRRFDAEAQTIARLEHPYIVPLYDYWREPGQAYLVMRWLRGGSLQASLERGSWKTTTAVQLVDQIATALAVAHRQHIIHRDIKPANILLDEEGNAYLADFGIASLTGALANLDNSRMPDREDSSGSLGYLSPEAAKGEPVTISADIYSLGVVLYELLTAQHPFPGLTGQELMEKHLMESLPDITAVRPDLPPAVNEVIQKATSKDPQDRYATAIDMAGAFRQALLPGGREFAIPPLESDIINPYKGLRPFQEADAAEFFGREELVSRLTADFDAHSKLDTGSFLALVGPSGSGKSSVVKAGLIPALRRGVVPGSENWFIIEMSPGVHPFEELEAALLRIAVNPPQSLLSQLQENERGLLRAVRRVLPDDNCRLLLVIDQFEELFTQVASEEERRLFLANLTTALNEPGSPLSLVLTLRADFYDRPLIYTGFGELMRANTEVILPLSAQELDRAITAPAENMGLVLEHGLAAEMIGDVANQPGALPLLQFALTELFENRQDDTMTLENYRSGGGVDGALSQRAESLFAGLNVHEQALTRQIFLRMVSLGEGVEDTRRRVLRSELMAIQAPETGETAITGDALPTILETFGGARILTFDRDPETREPTVEIAHEALLSSWDRLRLWLDDGREGVRLQRRLAAAAEEWDGAAQSNSYLLRGARLTLFAEWAANSDVALTSLEETYLVTSIAAREARHAEEEARRQAELETAQELAKTRAQANRRLRWLVLGLAGLLLVTLGAAFVAWQQSQRSDEQARLAMARELTTAALRAIDEDPELGILLALQAAATMQEVDEPVLPETEEALHLALLTDRLLYTVPGNGAVAYSSDGRSLATNNFNGLDLWNAQSGEPLLSITGHDDELFNLVFSADGTLLATTGYDNTAKLWNAKSGEELGTFSSGDLTPISPALSPDDSLLAISTEEGPVLVWDTTSGQKIAELPHDDSTVGIDFSSDGKRLAVTSFDSNAYLWDTTTWDKILTLADHGMDVNDTVFSPEGRRLATVSSDGTARVWDAESGEQLVSMMHGAWVFGVDISPDGTLIASGGTNGQAIVWETETGRQIATLSGHPEYVGNVAFNHDGSYLATGSPDGITRIWDITPAGSRDWSTLSGHDDMVFTVAYSPDGTRLASGSWDGTVKLWDPATEEELLTMTGHNDQVAHVAFASDGRRLASSSYDGTAKIWDTTSGDLLLSINPDTDYVWGIALSPDGKRLATGGFDGSLDIWDTENGQQIARFAGHQGPIWRLNYSPDGERLVSAGWDNSAKIWDADTGEELITLSGHEDSVNQALFSPDGSRLATSAMDGTVRLWDPQTGDLQKTLTGHTDAVWDVEFSPDGSTLASGGFDTSIRLWDTQSGEGILVLPSQFTIPDLVFSPDGRFLTVGQEDATIRTYILPIEELIALAETRVTRSLTEQDCRQYLHLEQCPGESPSGNNVS